MKRLLVVFAAISLVSFLPSAYPDEGEKRVALIIGNSNYKTTKSLINPANDARDMANALRKAGFQVISRVDAGRSVMRESIREFSKALHGSSVGLFYFAGHGLQLEGINYLVPIDAEVSKEFDIPDQCLSANYILGAMEYAETPLNIIILDACRNNPFRSFRGGGQGLAKMDAPKGSIVAYATAPGSVAMDGTGANGLYTSMLLKHMFKKGQPIESFFKAVRIDVEKASNGRQIPWESTSLTGEFYFDSDRGIKLAPIPRKKNTTPIKRETGGKIKIAVLPLRNDTGDAQLDWLGTGASEKLTTELLRLSDRYTLVERMQIEKVLAEQKFQQTRFVDPRTVVEIGKILGVQFVLIGSYQKHGGKIKFDVKKVSVDKGEIESGTELIGMDNDIFSLQDALAEKVLTLF